MRRPNKPHIAGFEDEEDCEGYFDQWEADRRGCFNARSSADPCLSCIAKGRAEEDAKRKAVWDAKTPEEKAAHEALVKGLRELY